MNIKLLQIELIKAFEKQGLNSTLSISKRFNITQSTVYRNLYGNPIKVTKGLELLCNYAKINSKNLELEPDKNAILMAALKRVWDGTDKHAKQLARLIDAASFM